LGDEEGEPLLLNVRGDAVAVRQDSYAVQRAPDDLTISVLLLIA
jgi:hypothetical protein